MPLTHLLNLPLFWDNVKSHSLEKFIIPIKKHSAEAYHDCPKCIAAIFIDGEHEYSSVKHDIIHYAPRVVKGGFIVFHDYSDYFPGVSKAVDELCNNAITNMLLYSTICYLFESFNNELC
ncbi:class I SAM-dependent methyltransferase [Peribacillus frigoritolerans]|uniref:class I SAM-dependent methyltransferase n=1 Tax=Peribacillus frigoritolerans TaxID=450367 RepID=UPI002079A763|nr:class I SAM-dependent methyltransferase [Peribacillus frigoritolerans]USK82054.1 class I SAM-dependent methyltransferase [Peribacillus frigoritolerans]WJE49346.1 class I SAM-dependent methyltransferase [Peribacillus frigoritolerans]